jgi:hypothetical protein
MQGAVRRAVEASHVACCTKTLLLDMQLDQPFRICLSMHECMPSASVCTVGSLIIRPYSRSTCSRGTTDDGLLRAFSSSRLALACRSRAACRPQPSLRSRAATQRRHLCKRTVCFGINAPCHILDPMALFTFFSDVADAQ